MKIEITSFPEEIITEMVICKGNEIGKSLKVRALWDTGSKISIINTRFLDKLDMSNNVVGMEFITGIGQKEVPIEANAYGGLMMKIEQEAHFGIRVASGERLNSSKFDLKLFLPSNFSIL